MGERQAILDGLLKDYNGAKVLYAKDVAKELGKPSAAAARALMNSVGCPLPVKHVGGKPAVTVFDMATWLAGEAIQVQPVEASVSASSPPAHASSVLSYAAPKRPRESLGKYLLSINLQREFLFELAGELEAIILNDSALDADSVQKPPL